MPIKIEYNPHIAADPGRPGRVYNVVHPDRAPLNISQLYVRYTSRVHNALPQAQIEIHLQSRSQTPDIAGYYARIMGRSTYVLDFSSATPKYTQDHLAFTNDSPTSKRYSLSPGQFEQDLKSVIEETVQASCLAEWSFFLRVLIGRDLKKEAQCVIKEYQNASPLDNWRQALAYGEHLQQSSATKSTVAKLLADPSPDIRQLGIQLLPCINAQNIDLNEVKVKSTKLEM